MTSTAPPTAPPATPPTEPPAQKNGHADTHNEGEKDLTDSARRLATSLTEMDSEHRRMRRYFCELLSVSMTEFNLVIALDSKAGKTPKELATQLHLTTGAMTALLDRLEMAGLVVRSPHPTDRRSLVIHLSASGLVARNSVNHRYIDAVTTAIASSADLASDELTRNIDFLTGVFGTVIGDSQG